MKTYGIEKIDMFWGGYIIKALEEFLEDNTVESLGIDRKTMRMK